MELLYVTTKYIVARSIKEALKKEKDTDVHDCYLEKTSMGVFAEEELKRERSAKSTGFNTKKEK